MVAHVMYIYTKLSFIRYVYMYMYTFERIIFQRRLIDCQTNVPFILLNLCERLTRRRFVNSCALFNGIFIPSLLIVKSNFVTAFTISL